jgi:hypothetical protein
MATVEGHRAPGAGPFHAEVKCLLPEGHVNWLLWILSEGRSRLEVWINLNGHFVRGKSEHMLMRYGCPSELEMFTVQLDILYLSAAISR